MVSIERQFAIDDAKFVLRLLENGEVGRSLRHAELLVLFIKTALDKEGENAEALTGAN
jgi:hypothetical protein